MDEQLYKAATEGMNLPHDVIQLPSQGIFYKNKKKSVKIGYLTASDENLIISQVQNNPNDVVLSLIRNKLYEPELKVEELLEGDVQAILIFLRNTSFGSEYKMTLIDPKTNKPFDVDVVLDQLKIKQLETQPDSNGNYLTNLPKSGDMVKLKLLSYHENTEITESFANYPVGRVAPIITTKLLKQIVSINDNEDKNFISQYITLMPIADSKFIRNFLNQNQPGLDLKQSFKAPSGEIVEAEINFGVEFFRPFF